MSYAALPRQPDRQDVSRSGAGPAWAAELQRRCSKTSPRHSVCVPDRGDSDRAAPDRPVEFNWTECLLDGAVSTATIPAVATTLRSHHNSASIVTARVATPITKANAICVTGETLGHRQSHRRQSPSHRCEPPSSSLAAFARPIPRRSKCPSDQQRHWESEVGPLSNRLFSSVGRELPTWISTCPAVCTTGTAVFGDHPGPHWLAL
jgi:hypothetical protein